MKLLDDNGNDIIQELKNENEKLKIEIQCLNVQSIQRINDILKLTEKINILQEQIISLQNSTLSDVIKNSFSKKKTNIKQSTIEIND